MNPETLNQSPLWGLAKKAMNRTEPDFDSTLFLLYSDLSIPCHKRMTVFDLQWLLTTVADPSFEQEPSVEQSQCVTVPFWNDLGLCLTYCMIVDASVVWPFQFGKESATKLNPDTACSWQA